MSTQPYRDDPQLRRLERAQVWALALGGPACIAIVVGALAGALGRW